MQKTTTSRYIFDRPDPNEAKKERDALLAVALGGHFSADTYRDRLARTRRETSTQGERRKARAFNRRPKKASGFPCVDPDCRTPHLRYSEPLTCFWCRRRHGEPLPVAAPTQTGRPRMESPRKERNALMR